MKPIKERKMNTAQYLTALAVQTQLSDVQQRLYAKAGYYDEHHKPRIDITKPAFAMYLMVRAFYLQVYDDFRCASCDAQAFAEVLQDSMLVWHESWRVLKDGDDSCFSDIEFYRSVFHEWCTLLTDEGEEYEDADYPSYAYPDPFRDWFLLDDESERMLKRLQSAYPDQFAD